MLLLITEFSAMQMASEREIQSQHIQKYLSFLLSPRLLVRLMLHWPMRSSLEYIQARKFKAWVGKTPAPLRARYTDIECENFSSVCVGAQDMFMLFYVFAYLRLPYKRKSSWIIPGPSDSAFTYMLQLLISWHRENRSLLSKQWKDYRGLRTTDQNEVEGGFQSSKI